MRTIGGGGRLRPDGCGRPPASAACKDGAHSPPVVSGKQPPIAAPMKNGRPGGRPCRAAQQRAVVLRGTRTRYSAMSAAAFAGRAGALPVACDGVLRSIFGGGASCSTSLVYVHSSTTFAGLSFSFVP